MLKPNSRLSKTMSISPSRSVRKIVNLDDHIALAYAGLKADARVLINRAHIECQSHKLTVEDPVIVEYITRYIAGLQQKYAQSVGVRPLGLSALNHAVYTSFSHLSVFIGLFQFYAKNQGYLDVELNDVGRLQAVAVVELLSKGSSIFAVYSSDLKQALETAQTTIASSCGVAEVIAGSLWDCHCNICPFNSRLVVKLDI